jgi:hypothetical protein
MVIDDFDVFRTAIRPSKTDAKLIVDADTALPTPVAAQCFEAIAGRRCQIAQLNRRIQLDELARADFRDGAKTRGLAGLE